MKFLREEKGFTLIELAIVGNAFEANQSPHNIVTKILEIHALVRPEKRKISLDSELEMLYNGHVENDIMISFSS